MRISDWSSDVCSADLGDMLVANVQMELNDYGYDAGPEDGVLGLVTVSAIRHFQADQGLPVTGRIDDGLLAHVADPRKGMRPGSSRERAAVNRRVEEGSGTDSHHLDLRSEEHTSELQSLMRNSYAVFCLTKTIV